jgi:E2F-associated phosphoprotein
MASRVDTGRTVEPREQKVKTRGKRRRGDRQPEPEAASGLDRPRETFHPVTCAVCDAEMGVWSRENEVYHFFHVVPSNA